VDVRRRRWVMCVIEVDVSRMFVYGILMDSGCPCPRIVRK
jgi:hypothetical protein